MALQSKKQKCPKNWQNGRLQRPLILLTKILLTAVQECKKRLKKRAAKKQQLSFY
jgi:hypothetical protein